MSSQEISNILENSPHLPLEEKINLFELQRKKAQEEKSRTQDFIKAYQTHTSDYIRHVIRPQTTSAEERRAVEYLLGKNQ